MPRAALAGDGPGKAIARCDGPVGEFVGEFVHGVQTFDDPNQDLWYPADFQWLVSRVCVYVCVCARARVRACVRACVFACVRVYVCVSV